MNQDNQRLKEIQTLKKSYKNLILESENIHDMFHYKNLILELEDEEKEILKRCDVII